MFGSVHIINLVIMIELLISGHFFAGTLKKRENYKLRLVLSCFGCVMYAYLFPVDLPGLTSNYAIWGMVMYLSFFLILCVSLCLCYAEKMQAILFCAVAGQTTQNMASSVNTLVRQAASLLSVQFSSEAIYLLTVPAVHIICYICFYKRLRKNPEIKIDSTALLMVSGAAIFVELFLALVTGYVSQKNPQPMYESLIAMYAAIACIFILSVEFQLLRNQTLESELTVMQQLIEVQKKQYQLSEANVELINLKCHDLKHQIHSLRKRGVVVSNDTLKEIENAVGIYDSVAHTGSEPLDVVLTEKNMLCEKNDIHLTCMAEGHKLGFISSSDIYTLFGNAIDNAIEAVMKLEDHNQRNISVNIRENRNTIVIRIENYFSGGISFKDGEVMTSKDDGRFHGFGIKSMKLIAEKYGGNLAANAEGNIFFLNIMIPIPEKAAP